ncbi:hypothetical protein [Actinomycetospora chiangmaiensis]|uniref:hypothetical protein n=1 Tax=Actinomycetospora chiangmaiensis TaxID=402650 RepID=UPI001B7FC0ED|nr:hypothetical protein [Actinomycetospora chiangmaiensis]
MVLTGNAGTGKTAVAEAFCETLNTTLPSNDQLSEVAADKWVVKDLSGLPDPRAREDAMASALTKSLTGQALVCANEGVLRDTLEGLHEPGLLASLDLALRHGASHHDVPAVTFVNVNRQRPTADGFWQSILEYLFRDDLWRGCDGCPFDSGACPMRSNAEKLRSPVVQEQVRTLLRLASGDAVPTLREVLAILSWAVVGGHTCHETKNRFRDIGPEAFTASEAYYTRLVGGGLPDHVLERSPLLVGLRSAGLGEVSDLEIDGWLRDSTGAPSLIRGLAGNPQVRARAADGDDQDVALAGTVSALDRVSTLQGAMTFHALGEMVSTDEDPTRVEDGLDALVGGRNNDAAGQVLWRQRVFFEGVDPIGGPTAVARRLLDYRHTAELIALAHDVAAGRDTVLTVRQMARGLNFLVTGFSSADEGLIVPDPACLFARDPGSFRPASPSLVHSQISLNRLSLSTPDQGLVEDLLDVDHIEVELIVDDNPTHLLRIKPRMYEAICEAAEYQGPVGQGVAEMNDLRAFYGTLASTFEPDGGLRVANPKALPPTLVNVALPHFTSGGTE